MQNVTKSASRAASWGGPAVRQADSEYALRTALCKTINYKNIRSWQNTVGFVSQSIFLTDGTIADNIAFGVPKEEINMQQVEHVIQLAHLSEFVSNLEHGYKTNVGERGVQISGGQRQRIGIARALYNQSKVLIFDEATSSLDVSTEEELIKRLRRSFPHKTIFFIIPNKV